MAQAIVDVISRNGGVMTLDDLSSHESEIVNPVSTVYKVRSPTLDAECISILITFQHRI